jgi:hypothetical protein
MVAGPIRRSLRMTRWINDVITESTIRRSIAGILGRTRVAK